MFTNEYTCRTECKNNGISSRIRTNAEHEIILHEYLNYRDCYSSKSRKENISEQGYVNFTIYTIFFTTDA